MGMVLFLGRLPILFPLLLNLRQYELFDPVIYSSNGIEFVGRFIHQCISFLLDNFIYPARSG